MAEPSGNLEPGSVTNETVWGYTRLLFGVALCFLLVNIGLGLLNASATGSIPHWQIVTHLHSAALGWFTLSAIALALWVFTGRRTVSDGYVRAVRVGSWLAILTVVGLLPAMPSPSGRAVTS